MCNPPKLFHNFFRWFCHPKMLKHIEGDLLELFGERVKEKGKVKADIRFILDVIFLFRPGIIRPVEGYKNLNTWGMYKSYFKTGWRSLIKNRSYSYINLVGLATGMAVTILIGVWVFDELAFNKNHLNYSRIAQIHEHKIVNDEIQTGAAPVPLADELRGKFANDVKHVVRMWWQSSHTLAIADLKIPRTGTFIEKAALEMFSIPMISGSWKSLDDPSSIVLSEPTAKALFGDKDPINQVLRIDDMMDVKVTGVYEELPVNSSFHSWQFLSTWDLWVSSNEWMKEGENDWTQDILTFAEIQPGSSFEAISDKIQNLKASRLPTEIAAKENPRLFLQPMSRWHLHGEWKNGKEAGGRIQFVWLFGTIGVFVLLLACINFMNLSTAQSQMRAREVGIRKSIGSARMQLVGQFFIETFLIVMVSFTLALVMATIAMPLFNELADKNMSMPWSEPVFIVFSLAFVLLTSLLAGSYPALFLSSFKPIKVLKGTFKLGRLADAPRKVLVIVQFVVSVTLIVGTITVWRQVQFAKDRPIGYTREGLVMVRKNSPEFRGKTNGLRNKLKDADAIVELAESATPATETWFTVSDFSWQGKDPDATVNFGCTAVSHQYGKTMGWQFIQGRDFSKEHSTDSSGIILNQTAARIIGWDNPIDQEIIFDDVQYKVIGVLQDMIVDSPYETVKPAVYFLQHDHTLNMIGNVWITIRLNPNLSTHEAITRLENVFRSVLPSVAFEFKFVDQEFENKFSAEVNVGTLANLFAVLAIFISCLGLFGLASFVVQQRTKEIGVRKILGASAFNLWAMLSKEFLLLVAIAIAVAAPVSYLLLGKWLMQFNYRVELSIWFFVAAGVVATIITLVTVSFQSIKAALMNPVKSLRSE